MGRTGVWVGLLLLAAGLANAGITGRVVNPDGQPVAGAQVYLMTAERGDAAPAASTATDADGRFGFATERYATPWRPVQASPDWPFAQVIVAADGYALGGADTPRDGAVTVRLEPPTALRVPVIGPEEVPATGVSVRLRYLTRMAPWRGLALTLPTTGLARATALTDATGVARFEGLPTDTRVTVELDDDRYAIPGGRDVDDEPHTGADEEATATPLRVVAAAGLKGRVTGDGGRGLAGAEVRWTSLPDQAVRRAVVAADGSYQLTRLRPGVGTLSVRLPQELAATWVVPASEGLELTAGETRPGVELTAVRGLPLTVRVAAENGPVPGALVNVFGPQLPRSVGYLPEDVWLTGADGSATRAVLAGTQKVEATYGAPPGYGPTVRDSAASVEATAGQPAEATVKLARQAFDPVQGVVVDPNGQPVAGAAVQYRSSWVPVAPLLTDAQGRFALPRRDGEPVSLRARSGRLMAEAPVWARPGETVTLKLVDNALARVSARVIDEDNKPVAGATVVLGEYRDGGSNRRQATDADGRVTFNQCYPCSATLVARAPGFGRIRTNFALKPGEDHDAGLVRLPRAGHVVMGTVVDPDDRPVAMAMVSADQLNLGRQTVTDAQGHWRLEDIVGPVNVLVWTFDDRYYARQTVTVGDEPAVIKLRPQQRGR